MNNQVANYDDVKQYRLGEEKERELVNTGGGKMAQATAIASERAQPKIDQHETHNCTQQPKHAPPHQIGR